MTRQLTTALLVLLCCLTNLFGARNAASAQDSGPNVYFAYRSFWPEHETMKRFASVGVHTYCVFPSNTDNSLGEPYSKYPAIWRYPDKYDWDSLYRQFDEILAFDPDAEFLCMVDLNSPTWLARTLGMSGDGAFDSFIDLSSCLASKAWRDYTEKYLVDFLAQTETRYGEKIKAYVLACGQTDEWMDYCAERTSRAKNQAYREWTQKNNLPEYEWPDFDEFDSASFENQIRDPKKEANVLQALRFEQELIADGVLQFAKLAKEKTDRKKEIGVFFGYILELTGWRANGCGHLAYEKVMNSDDVDFFISPGTYSERVIGGGSGSMAPNETILLSGKRRLHETDHRTTTYNCALNEFVGIAPISQWKNEDEDVAGLRRELSLALIDHASIWFFDMWGGSFKSDRAIENVATMKQVWDENVGKQGERVAEILLVCDPQSAERINDRESKSSLTYCYIATRNRLNHVGAPYAVCSFDDLKRMDLSKVKLAILPGSFYLNDERHAVLREKLLCEGRAVLWVGAAGLDDGTSLDLENVLQTTGVDYGKTELDLQPRVGFFGKGDGDWRSAAIARHANVDVASIRRVAQASGVKLYVDDDSPVYASKNLVAIHSAKSGVKRVALPERVKRVTELFSKKVVAENCDAFEYDFAEPETALFKLEF